MAKKCSPFVGFAVIRSKLLAYFSYMSSITLKP